MTTTKKINANGTEISVLLQGNENDYICLTDMARYKDKQRTNYIIQNWMRARNTIEYLGVWEQLHNPSFNSIEFDAFRNQSGLHSFSLTPTEADMLNLALFGYTAKDWEEANPELAKKLNMRDTASINELVVLSNLESLNSELIKQGMPRDVRYDVLHRVAEEQLKVLNVQNVEYRFKKLTSGTDIIE